ncbi:MAG: hypothetical protein M0Q43_10750 [Methanothrix sp.]|jgi:hypothetical protein|nr:hypothetical protein [Methanothrix sp.]
MAQVAQVLAENEKLKGQEDALKHAEATARQDAADADARGVDKDRLVKAIQAKLAKVTGKPLDPLPGINGVDIPGPDGATEVVVLRELVAAQDARHETDEERIKARDRQIDAQGKALILADLRADILESQLRSMTKPRSWAAGVAYGSDGQMGVSVERDLGPVRIGADVVRHRLPGNNTTLEAVGRLLWRF